MASTATAHAHSHGARDDDHAHSHGSSDKHSHSHDDHAHAHSHGSPGEHDHGHGSPAGTTPNSAVKRVLLLAAAVALLFMAGEIIGGFYAGSLAILTDAAHLLSDVAAFMISLFAVWLAERRPTQVCAGSRSSVRAASPKIRCRNTRTASIVSKPWAHCSLSVSESSRR